MKPGAGGWCHTNTNFIWHWASERTTHPTFTVYEQLLWNQPFNKCLTSLCHFFPLYDTMTTLHRWLSNRPWKWFSLRTKCPECVKRACVILCEAITTFSRCEARIERRVLINSWGGVRGNLICGEVGMSISDVQEIDLKCKQSPHVILHLATDINKWALDVRGSSFTSFCVQVHSINFHHK